MFHEIEEVYLTNNACEQRGEVSTAYYDIFVTSMNHLPHSSAMLLPRLRNERKYGSGSVDTRNFSDAQFLTSCPRSPGSAPCSPLFSPIPSRYGARLRHSARVTNLYPASFSFWMAYGSISVLRWWDHSERLSEPHVRGLHGGLYSDCEI
jgi:hypothetical protein